LNNLSFCGSANYAITTGAAWLGVSPADGTIGPGQGVTIVVSVDAAQVPAGEGNYVGFSPSPAERPVLCSLRDHVPRRPVAFGFADYRPVQQDARTLFVRVSATDDIGVTGVVVNYTPDHGRDGFAGTRSS